MECVLDASFLFLHLGLGRGANTDYSDATGELRQPFLQLFAVVVRRGFLDLAADLIDPALDLRGLAMTFHDGRVFLVHNDRLGTSEVFQPD
jgi:hypothetical protein